MAKELSWKAVRNGDIYCAPACGGKCTYAMYLEAIERGNRCVRELGKGWTVRVSENLGWHTTVLSPCQRINISVHPVRGTPGETLMNTLDSYTAFFGERDKYGRGGKWSAHGDTPAEAVNNVVSIAKAELDRINACFKRLPRWKGKRIA